MSSGKNILKVIIGIVLIIVGIAWYFVPRIPLISDAILTPVPFWRAFLILFAGVFGLGLLFVGLIVAWMGYDDYKTEIEMAKEEKEEKKEEEKKEN